MKAKARKLKGLEKTPSGISGLDEIMEGGYPKGRPVLICGNTGCGKSMFAIQFLVKGIEDGEPGVLMTFEETPEDLIQNVGSMGIDLKKMVDEKKLHIDHVRIERSEIEETGEFDLEGLFVRLNYAIDSIGAKRVVLDTIESLFAGIDNLALLRSELGRLFHWLKRKGITAVITGERGDKSLTRQGLEEYISDCVILLDFRISEQIATRRLRIVKYRGSGHGTNEYPFLIGSKGISVLPITSMKLDHASPREIISTGVAGLDALFSEGGYYRGSCILISGAAGTAKTILASSLALSFCKRKERVLYFSFEESPDQLVHNMQCLKINLKPFVKSGMLQIHSSHASLHGLEMHLITLYNTITEFRPHAVIIDPVTSLLSAGSAADVKSMMVRLISMLKHKNITALFTALASATGGLPDIALEEISSQSDTWLKLRNEETPQHIVLRSLRIVKSRGMGHSGALKDFIITGDGIVMANDASAKENGENGQVAGIIKKKNKNKLIK